MVCGCSVVFATSAAHNSNIQHGLMYGGQARAPHNQRRTAAGVLQGGAQKKRRRGGRQIAGISQLATSLLKFNPPPRGVLLVGLLRCEYQNQPHHNDSSQQQRRQQQ